MVGGSKGERELVKFLEVPYKDGRYRLGLSVEAVFQMSAQSHRLAGLEGEKLYGALMQLGAVLHDGDAGEPAVEVFWKTGKRLHVAHYREGERHDGPSGEPAVQWFDEKTGVMVEANSAAYGPLSPEQLARWNEEWNLVEKLPPALEMLLRLEKQQP